MISWPSPFLPAVPGTGGPLRLLDTASGDVHEVTPEDPATMYVCGITPYDATHIGHAATYVTFDVLDRTLRDAGHDVVYVQNVTDIDDPLLERAAPGERRHPLGGVGDHGGPSRRSIAIAACGARTLSPLMK